MERKEGSKWWLLGGLGIHNLEIIGWALKMRWLWIGKTKPERSWAGLKIPIHMNTLTIFAILVVTSVGNGENTMFSTYWWIHAVVYSLAPNVLKSVPPGLRNKITVAEAFHEVT